MLSRLLFATALVSLPFAPSTSAGPVQSACSIDALPPSAPASCRGESVVMTDTMSFTLSWLPGSHHAGKVRYGVFVGDNLVWGRSCTAPSGIWTAFDAPAFAPTCLNFGTRPIGATVRFGIDLLSADATTAGSWSGGTVPYDGY